MGGFLEVGVNAENKVVLNHPDLDRDEHGVAHIVFSPDEARGLGLLLLKHASAADGFPGSKEPGEFFIDFNTEIDPGKIQAVRVRIDLVTVRKMDEPMDIGLADHPLYKELRKYIKLNPR